eukprot:8101714-Pyramimonas_sp.AAC.1
MVLPSFGGRRFRSAPKGTLCPARPRRPPFFCRCKGCVCVSAPRVGDPRCPLLPGLVFVRGPARPRLPPLLPSLVSVRTSRNAHVH